MYYNLELELMIINDPFPYILNCSNEWEITGKCFWWLIYVQQSTILNIRVHVYEIIMHFKCKFGGESASFYFYFEY